MSILKSSVCTILTAVIDDVTRLQGLQKKQEVKSKQEAKAPQGAFFSLFLIRNIFVLWRKF